ncbi:MAG TPA: hypothetical protein VEN47_05115 [Myxococcota bacterium]|nr:hypothetical protein [Myxococcota bacterium]
MADEGERIRREVDALRTLRDELRVQLNLAGKEARDAYESAEKTWQKLEGKLRRLQHESGKELAEVGDAARAFAKEISESYKRLRALL